MRRFVVLAAFAALLIVPAQANASPYVRSGVQDDAWLEYGPGTLDDRLDQLDDLGVDVVRVTIDWRLTEPRPGVYDWARADSLLDGLHERGIAPLVTLYGSPRWANRGRAENWAPVSTTSFAAFARRIADRFPYIRMWTIWNEPNQRRWLRPTTPSTYVKKLLNPAYAAIHSVSPRSQVAGGVTAPRGSKGGVSPVDWIAGMAKAHARLDAYAHNPYPLRRGETPMSGGCDHCETITMATLPRLLRDVRKAFGVHTRIWLTEYGYQTNPPDRLLGVSYATQAKYMSEAALCAYEAPRVDVLIHYLLDDEPDQARWQSGVYTATERAKPALQSLRFPFTERSRSGRRTTLWGQIRPGGVVRYRLLRWDFGKWVRVGADRRTTARGYVTRVVNATAGARYRLWIPAEHTYSAIATVT
ncbi:MAG TPA: cellulase family glycosylhydrolase [Gaiellaceae bacterium]|nr:cellulase family glycosylhydrolase [Gaiellaceae bacterium]